MKMRKARHAIVETMSAHPKFGSRGVRWLDSPELRPARPATICQAEVRMLEGSSRLTAAGQDFRAQSQLPPEPAIPRLPGARPLHLQQRPLNSDEPHEGAERLLSAEATGSSRSEAATDEPSKMPYLIATST